MRFTLLAIVSLTLGCFTTITDPNHWNIGDGDFSQFLADSDLCREQASHPLQPELSDAPMDEDFYRSCMESSGWTER